MVSTGSDAYKFDTTVQKPPNHAPRGRDYRSYSVSTDERETRPGLAFGSVCGVSAF